MAHVGPVFLQGECCVNSTPGMKPMRFIQPLDSTFRSLFPFTNRQSLDADSITPDPRKAALHPCLGLDREQESHVEITSGIADPGNDLALWTLSRLSILIPRFRNIFD